MTPAKPLLFSLALAANWLPGMLPGAHGAETFVAGFRPYERPVGYPVVVGYEGLDRWKEQAVRGLGQPVVGLKFMDDQGAWYTPFNRANLLGRYDLRGLHGGTRKD